MKSVFAKFVVLSALWALLAVPVIAAPSLEPIPDTPNPTEVQPGHPYTFNMMYKGDPPTALKMVLQTPGGDVTVNATPPSGDTTQGVPVSWTYTPENQGPYHYHFEAVAGDLGAVRYPAKIENDPQFISSSLTAKYIIFLVGLLVGLLFLPFVVYVLSRSINKRGDPAAAARVALLIGIIASYSLFLYLFYSIYSPLMLALAGIVALAILIVLFTRRRAY